MKDIYETLTVRHALSITLLDPSRPLINNHLVTAFRTLGPWLSRPFALWPTPRRNRMFVRF
jgi:hypothetical protein